MGAIHAPESSIEQILEKHSSTIKQRISDDLESFGDLIVRKFPSRLEPQSYIPADSDIPFDRARFGLVMSNGREEWRVTMDLIFHVRRRLQTDGSMLDPGLQFNVVDEDGKSIPVDYVSLNLAEEDLSMPSEEWAVQWFQKLVRKSEFSVAFAYKEFERELEY